MNNAIKVMLEQRKQNLEVIKEIHIPNTLRLAKEILANRDYLENLPKESTWDTRRIMDEDFMNRGILGFRPGNAACENIRLYQLYRYDLSRLLGYTVKPEYEHLAKEINFMQLIALTYVIKTRTPEEIKLDDTWATYPVGGEEEWENQGWKNTEDAHGHWRNPRRYEYIQHVIDVLENFLETGYILGIEKICDKVEF